MSATAQFVLGTAQIGLPYGIANRVGMMEEAAAARLLETAYDLGVRGVDTASAYGESEVRVGAALGAAAGVRIVTKLTPIIDGMADAADAEVLAAVDASIERSRRALRRDRLDALLLHRAMERRWRDGLVWLRLREHQAAGRIGALGVSAYEPAEVLDALGDPSVQALQFPFNLLDHRWLDGGLVEALATRPDVSVHVRSVFLQGLLADPSPALWSRVMGDADAATALAAMSSLRERTRRGSVRDLAIAWVRAQPWIDGAVVGAETIEQLRDSVGLFNAPPLTDGDLAAAGALEFRLAEALLSPSNWPK